MVNTPPTAADFDPLIALYNARRYADLENQVRALLAKHPSTPFAWQLLGGALQMQGKDALAAFQKVVTLSPNDASAHFNLGVAYKTAGQLEQAVESYRNALAIKPDYVEALSNLGNTLQDLGQLDEAVQCYQQALVVRPNAADTQNKLTSALGAQEQTSKLNQLIALFNAGHFVEVEARANLLILQYPDSSIAWKLLGNCLHRQGKSQEALFALFKSVKLKQNDAETHFNLGITKAHLGYLKEAEVSYRQALLLRPNFAEAYNNLGDLLVKLEKYSEAVDCCQSALAINPNYVGALFNLGNALVKLGQRELAIKHFRQAIALEPNFAEAHFNLGCTFSFLGQINDALMCYRKTLEIKPDHFDAHTSLLFSFSYVNHTPAEYLTEALRFGKITTSKITSRFDNWKCISQPKKLRVGLVSGDLRIHSVGYFLENFLTQIDPTRIELFGYPTQPHEDELTERIKPYFSHWQHLATLNDQAAAALIHSDGIHVLLDLSGHTQHNRLTMFAWKPAPVQCTWLGYFASTGIAEMDYILGDKWMLPKKEANHFVEKGWQMGGAQSCFAPPTESVAVTKLPALQNRYITFGTLNRIHKINDRVIACWARVLKEIPGSKLYLNTYNLFDNTPEMLLVERFFSHGITENQLILESTSGREAALNSYSKIDIALDPFPYPGGTTSYEALWMGVPVLTMVGNTYISHLGESIAHNAGLSDWIAQDEDDYVAKAIHFARDLPKLAALRAGLREQVRVSPLFDAPRFARHFEEALWGMWQAKGLLK